MNKQQFIDELMTHLSFLSRSEREKAIQSCFKKFEQLEREGKTEKEAIAEMGSPEKFALKLIAENSIDQPDAFDSNFKSIAAGIGLIFITIILLGPALGVAGIYFGLYGVAFILIIVPVYLFVKLITSTGSILVLFFITLFTLSLGILIMNGLILLGKKLIQLVKIYIQFVTRTFKGERAV